MTVTAGPTAFVAVSAFIAIPTFFGGVVAGGRCSGGVRRSPFHVGQLAVNFLYLKKNFFLDMTDQAFILGIAW